MDRPVNLPEPYARTPEERDQQKDFFAKQVKHGVSLNVIYHLDDGRRAIKIKKVDEKRATCYAVQLFRPTLTHDERLEECLCTGETIYTERSDIGQKMKLRVLKKRGRKWLLKILGTEG